MPIPGIYACDCYDNGCFSHFDSACAREIAEPEAVYLLRADTDDGDGLRLCAACAAAALDSGACRIPTPADIEALYDE